MNRRRTRRREHLLAALDREGRRTGSVSHRHSLAIAGRLDMEASDFVCLDVLDWAGPVTAGELARHLGLTAGGTTGVIDRLEDRGWVRRVRDPHDRRKVIVELVAREADTAALGPLTSLVDEMDEINESYDDAQLDAICDWLRRANDALERSIERLRGPRDA